MLHKKNPFVRCAVMVVTVLVIVLSTRYSSAMIRTKLNLEIQDSLQLVAEQNALFTEKELLSKQSFLRGIAKGLPVDSVDDKDRLLDMLRPFTELYDLKRLGFIYPDGTAYTTDGYVSNLAFRENFQVGMAGKSCFTEVLEDTIGAPDQINVFSIPVYYQNGNMVAGVLFATYRTEMLHDLLGLECFNGQGYSCIIQPDGKIITTADNAPFFGAENLLSSLRELGADPASLDQMEKQINNHRSGLSVCDIPEGHYIYYMPLDSSDMDLEWYILTVVPTSVLDQRLSQVFYYVDLLIGIVVVVLIAAFFYYIYSYLIQRKQLTTLAYIDPLTGGDNYASFKEKMQKKKGCSGYMISIDIYEFRIINNTCGNQKGNEVLQRVWNILSSHLTGNSLAAHIHADRFILFLADCTESELLEWIGRVNDEVSQVAIDLHTPRVTLYLGIYATEEPEDTEKGYGCANQAKHAVQNRLEKNYSFYEEIDYQQRLENLRLEDGFDKAIQNHHFEVWYQPKYSTKDQCAVSAEALVRWRDVDGHLIPPYKFIPLFEKNGMISILDEYVFETVCAQQKQWEKEGRKVLPVSVNISRSSLYYSDIVEKYEAILRSHDLAPENVELEITESAAVNNTEIRSLIERFHKIGFRMLLDDFGNGYSSLATLNQMHFDTLKLDKSLIDYIGDQNGETLLYHIIKLAQSLGLKITAEGVEDQAQFEFLRQLSCDDIQGYYFSKPLPLERYQTLVYGS